VGAWGAGGASLYLVLNLLRGSIHPANFPLAREAIVLGVFLTFTIFVLAWAFEQIRENWTRERKNSESKDREIEALKSRDATRQRQLDELQSKSDHSEAYLELLIASSPDEREHLLRIIEKVRFPNRHEVHR
jgi:hypothetical protein